MAAPAKESETPPIPQSLNLATLTPLIASVGCFLIAFFVKVLICESSTVWLDVGPSLATWAVGIAYSMALYSPKKLLGSMKEHKEPIKINKGNGKMAYTVTVEWVPPNHEKVKLTQSEEVATLFLVVVLFVISYILYAWGYADYRANQLKPTFGMYIKAVVNGVFGLCIYAWIVRYQLESTKG